MFPLARKPLFTDRNAFKNTFPLDGKINLAVAELSQNGRKKKCCPLTRKSAPPAGIKFFFSKIESPGFHKQQKSLNKRILFQLDRKSVSTGRNGEFV